MARKFVCTKTEPIVQTVAGKLRGFIIDGVYTFQGVQYAKAERFRQPEPIEPWDGVKDALAFGYVCPLLKKPEPSNELMVLHRYWPEDEDCLNLNVWTTSIDPAAKKPVMVWLHGGGFTSGSAIEHLAYEGENLSRFGDVVVVSVNHRLNVLGYLDLSPFGEKYANSGNAGNADIVAALQWVHDNIAAFGGDADNVTIFGQSGGGMKVWSLMQTPAADGLFHKGIIQSGAIENYMDGTGQDGTVIVNAIMEELGFEDVKQLETVPYHMLAAAYNKVSPALKAAGHYVGCSPQPNGWYLGDPCVVGFCEHARTIPVMIGSVLGEFSFMPALDPRVKNDPEAVEALLQKKYGKHTDELKALFAQVYPHNHPSDLYFLDSIMRSPSIKFAKMKAEHPESPTYTYLFAYEPIVDGGHIAWHCCEIPFVFHNTCLTPALNEEGVTDLLEKQLSEAWVSFARDGAPVSEALPHWPACTPGDEACMIFDKVCAVRHNHDHELIALHAKVTPGFGAKAEEKDNKIQH